ncbi:MAG: hypothetical protein PHQ19_07320 [Candidatus Krumholzibacteria bacterium]|nr:hypothetical protein [Candidatus Krumholzibacteria bacterium]
MRPDRMRCAAAILVAALWAAAPVPAAGEGDVPAAILLSCTGEVTVARAGGDRTAGSFGMALYAGDEVLTDGGSEAEIHFENGTWLQVGANGRLMIKGAGSERRAGGVEVGKKSFEVVQNMLRLKDPAGTSSLASLRSAPQAPQIVLRSPCNTSIRPGPPLFVWEAPGLDEPLRLTLYGEDGVIHEAPARGSGSISYPDGSPALQPGIAYSWTVETTDPLRIPPIRSAAAFFEILPAGDAAALDEELSAIDPSGIRNEATYHFLRASAFFSHGLNEEAIAEMRGALEGDGGTREMRAILARLLAETGRTAEAMEEYGRIMGGR